MQDYNWPVAPLVRDVLVRHEGVVVEPVRQVLCGTDNMWQYWLMEQLVPRLSPAAQERLRPSILRLASTDATTPDQIALRQAAQDCLSACFGGTQP